MQRRDALRAMVASLAGAIALPAVLTQKHPGAWDRSKYDAFLRENVAAAQRMDIDLIYHVNFLHGGFPA